MLQLPTARRIIAFLILMIGWAVGLRFASPFGVDAWILGLIGVAVSVLVLVIAEVAVTWISHWLQP